VLVRAAKPFKVVGIDGTGDGITAELPAAPAALPVQVIVVKFEPKKPGSVAPQHPIRTDARDASAVLPVEAEGTPNGDEPGDGKSEDKKFENKKGDEKKNEETPPGGTLPIPIPPVPVPVPQLGGVPK
jgi:hypothetical protein